MKENGKKNTQLILNDLKIEISNLKKSQGPRKRTLYPESVKNRIRELLAEGLHIYFISKQTGVPVATIHGWIGTNKKKQKTSLNKFQKLEIVEVANSPHIQDEGEIMVFLSGDIKLSVPAYLMSSMMQILKEQWYVSRI